MAFTPRVNDLSSLDTYSTLPREPLGDDIRSGGAHSSYTDVSIVLLVLMQMLTVRYIYRPLRVAHSALGTRVLLNLRRAAAESSSGMSLSRDTYVQHTTLVFETSPALDE